MPTPNASDPISRDSRDLLPGTWLGGRFEVLARVGRGGTGWVYSAHDHKRRERIALKVLSRSGGEQAIRSGRRELEFAGAIEHENIVRVLGMESVSGRTVLRMELVEGESLRRILKRRGRLPVGECLRRIRQIAAGLEATHRHGIVHRDLKPGNVIVDRKGVARIADFGLSARIDDHDGRRFLPVGTPEYMAPEQVEGRRCGREADVFSLGVMAYEMLTGELPYRGKNGLDTALERLRRSAPDPRRLTPTIPRWLGDLVLGCLEREPRNRIATMGDLIVAIDAGEAGDQDLPTRPLAPQSHANVRIRVVVAAGLALVLFAAAWSDWRRTGSPTPPIKGFLVDGEIRIAVPEPIPVTNEASSRLIGAGVAEAVRAQLARHPGFVVLDESSDTTEQALTVRVLRLGNEVRISATVVSLPDRERFMAYQQVDRWENSFEHIDRIAGALVKAYIEEIDAAR